MLPTLTAVNLICEMFGNVSADPLAHLNSMAPPVGRVLTRLLANDLRTARCGCAHRGGIRALHERGVGVLPGDQVTADDVLTLGAVDLRLGVDHVGARRHGERGEG